MATQVQNRTCAALIVQSNLDEKQQPKLHDRAGLNILVSFVLDAFTNEMAHEAQKCRLEDARLRQVVGSDEHGQNGQREPFAIIDPDSDDDTSMQGAGGHLAACS
jgi:hypothetical protein